MKAAAALAAALLVGPGALVRADAPGGTGQSPAWEKGLEAASPYAGAASDVYGGASGSIDAAKLMRASDFKDGNRAARHVLAADYNRVRRSAQGLVKAAEKFSLGTLTTIADVGSTLAAHAVEGLALSLRTPQTAAAGGAWRGRRAAVARPVGAGRQCGGAGLGAMGADGYDTAADALRENGYSDVQTYVDSLVAEDPRAAFRQAQQNRREWLIEHGLAPIAGGDPEFVKPSEPPVATAEPSPPASIIPDDARSSHFGTGRACQQVARTSRRAAIPYRGGPIVG
jgi:hypothetical protein